jgi:hypothetical protein
VYANLARQVREHTVERARRARWQVLLVAPLIAGVVIAYSHREELFGVDLPVRIVAVIALVILGWTFARDLGRAVGPILFQRLDPGTAGTAGLSARPFRVGDRVRLLAGVPVEPSEGPELADEVLAALQQVSREVAAAPAAQR